MSAVIVMLFAGSSSLGQIGVKTFRNSYIEFEIPDAWGCQQEGTAFVCQEAGRPAVSMTAILAAKIVDPQRDNSAVYASELAKRREWKNQNGRVIISSGIRSESRCYGGKIWQWAHHYQSELENYHTEYFIRIEGNVSALVTVSFHRSVEAEGSSIAAMIARRLRVIGQVSAPSAQSGSEC